MSQRARIIFNDGTSPRECEIREETKTSLTVLLLQGLEYGNVVSYPWRRIHEIQRK